MESYKFPLVGLCGIDGSGKSTLLSPLARNLEAAFGVPCVTTRYPGATEVGKILREILLGPAQIGDEVTRQQLFAADLRATTVGIVVPALRAGHMVLSDRYILCNYAYGTASGISRDTALSLLAPVLEGEECRPVHVFDIILDLPVSVAMRREKKGDHGDTASQKFYEKVRKEYMQYALLTPDTSYILDATAPIERVLEEATYAITGLLKGYKGYLGEAE